jgi:formyltetrahydrofolate deformylase
MELETHVLTWTCPNRPGIVFAVAEALYKTGCDIVDAQEFVDRSSGTFFSRVDVTLPAGDQSVVRKHLSETMEALASTTWRFRPANERARVLILASQSDHCLGDLLYRWRAGDLAMDVVGVVSNYSRETHKTLQLEGVPYHHLPVTPETKQDQEAQIWQIVQDTGAELVVLARYMQILTEWLTTRLAGRCINIHHSFLPGFKGAKPYHQAYERGVKLVGATAHYVTADLDEGPIIEQAVEPISHRDTPATLVAKGKDIERRVLARAVQQHLEDRVLLNGHRTVVFPR